MDHGALGMGLVSVRSRLGVQETETKTRAGRKESVRGVFTPSPWSGRQAGRPDAAADLQCAVPFFSFYVYQDADIVTFPGSEVLC
jgi:hypothetical protein